MQCTCTVYILATSAYPTATTNGNVKLWIVRLHLIFEWTLIWLELLFFFLLCTHIHSILFTRFYFPLWINGLSTILTAMKVMSKLSQNETHMHCHTQQGTILWRGEKKRDYISLISIIHNIKCMHKFYDCLIHIWRPLKFCHAWWWVEKSVAK